MSTAAAVYLHHHPNASYQDVLDWVELVELTTEFRAIIHKVIHFEGLKIGLEYKPGDIRFKGSGHERKLRNGYGHIRKHAGADGEALDCYLPPTLCDGGEAPAKAFLVRQLNRKGEFDEEKIMLGYASLDEARAAYLKDMPERFLGSIEDVGIEALKPYQRQVKEPIGDEDADESGDFADIDLSPTQAMKSNASRGLELRKAAPKSRKGGLDAKQASQQGIGSGVQRASNIINSSSLSPGTWKRMKAFFDRHSAFKDKHTTNPPSKSYISWLLWGGDAGYSRAKVVCNQLDKKSDNSETFAKVLELEEKGDRFAFKSQWRKAYDEAKSKFNIFPSAYASAYIVKRYKELVKASNGDLDGAFEYAEEDFEDLYEEYLEASEFGDEEVEPDITFDIGKWFKEEWVRISADGSIMGECGGRGEGEGKPKCLPRNVAEGMSVKERVSAVNRKRNEDPDPDRQGKAKNVATTVNAEELELTQLREQVASLQEQVQKISSFVAAEQPDIVDVMATQGVQQMSKAFAVFSQEIRNVANKIQGTGSTDAEKFTILMQQIIQLAEQIKENSDTAQETREQLRDGMLAAKLFGWYEEYEEEPELEESLIELASENQDPKLRGSVALALIKSIYTDPITDFKIKDSNAGEPVKGTFTDKRSENGKTGVRTCAWKISEQGGEYFVSYRITSDTIADLEEPEYDDFSESSEEDYLKELISATNQVLTICLSEDELEQDSVEYMGLKTSGGRKNCVKGLSCGSSCILASRTCRKPLGEHFKKHAKWLVDGAPGQEAEKTAPTPKPAEEKSKDQPKAVDKPESNAAGYKPLMSEEEAIAYTKDSVYDGVFYHATSSVGADSITTDGVDIDRNKTGLYGKGFYVGGGKDGKEVAEFYGSMFGTKGKGDGAILEIRLNVKNPKVFKDSSEYMEFVSKNKVAIYKTKVAGKRRPSEEDRISEFFKKQGHDALEITKAGEYVLFDPKQVAVFKRGEF